MFTTEEVMLAYLSCRKKKRSKAQAIIFEAELAYNIVKITEELNSREYKIGTSRCFVDINSSPREVWAASFYDRVVHHVLCNRLFPIFEPTFSAASSACIEERGTLYGSQRLERFIRSGTESWTVELYFLQMDVSNFFVSIQKDIIDAIYTKKIECDDTLWLARKVLWHDPTTDYVISGCPSRLLLIPPHKSLFNAPYFMGLAIGNLPSQLDANIYMNVFDQHVQHKIKPFGYVRYVDDFVLVDRDIEKLKAAKDEIDQVLWSKLALVPNPTKTILGSVYDGVDFVGRVIYPYRTIPRQKLADNTFKSFREGTANAEALTSRIGLMRQSDSFNLRSRVCREAYRHGYSIDREFTKVAPYYAAR